jgi:predicted TIM-barrel fold metal-dependent hydrolase
MTTRTTPSLVLLFATGALAATAPPASAAEPVSPVALARIDAHAHFFAEAKPVLATLDRLNVTAVNICVVDRYDKGYETVAPQEAMARRLAAAAHGRLPWIGTFDDAGFADPGFTARALADVDRALAAGAHGVKVYKSLGMELRDASGRYLLPDDAAFAPFFDGLAKRGATVYAHIAEPIAAWQPLDPTSPDYDYYKDNPAWHVHGRPGMPTKEQVLEGRDRLLAKHPTLRVIGCHLGSMEEDVDQIARRLDRYRNFAVDTAARVTHLTLQPRDKVRAFLVEYEDRVLYATDFGFAPGQDGEAVARRLEDLYARDWAYFATAGPVDFEGRKVEGLGLPEPVLRKIFRDNARHWVPGLVKEEQGTAAPGASTR